MKKRQRATIFPAPATMAAALLGGLGIVATPQAARAQTTTFLPVRVKVGINNLQDGDARKIAGTPLYMAEADLFLPSAGTGKSVVTAGYQYRASHGDQLSVIPVTIAKLFSPNNPAQVLTGNIYYGLGAGLYFLHATKDGASESKTRPGGFAVAGYQLPGSYFVEAKYQLVSGGVKGVYANGVLLAVGKRF